MNSCLSLFPSFILWTLNVTFQEPLIYFWTCYLFPVVSHDGRSFHIEPCEYEIQINPAPDPQTYHVFSPRPPGPLDFCQCRFLMQSLLCSACHTAASCILTTQSTAAAGNQQQQPAVLSVVLLSSLGIIKLYGSCNDDSDLLFLWFQQCRCSSPESQLWLKPWLHWDLGGEEEVWLIYWQSV